MIEVFDDCDQRRKQQNDSHNLPKPPVAIAITGVVYQFCCVWLFLCLIHVILKIDHTD